MDIINCFYYSPNKERQQEIEYTLNSNLNKNFINNIHLFIKKKDYDIFINSNFTGHANYNKIIPVLFEGQPTYPELFTYSCNLKNIICCICNSDIEFIIENINILQKVNNENIIYFITRHEYDDSSPLINNYEGSHDAFIFHSDTMKKNIENKDLNFINYKQNTMGIEALLTIYFIEQLKYTIFNPCFQIKLIHHHKSNVRIWNKTLSPRVGYTSLQQRPGSPGIHNKYMIYPCNL